MHYEGHNNLLGIDTHYNFYQDEDKWYLRMIPESSGISYHPDAHVALKYSYKYEDSYTSYWEGYIIADSDSHFIVNQLQYSAYVSQFNNDILKWKPMSSFGTNVVGSVYINTLEGDLVYTAKPTDKNIRVNVSKGVYKVRIFCLSDPDTKYAAKKWSPYSSDFIETGPNLKLVPRVEPIKLINFDVLLHSTPYENDNRASIIEEHDNSKYIVVKEPSQNLIPGYYYDKYRSSYIREDANLIRNIGHYQRRFINQSGASGYYTEHLITGSSGNIIMSGDYMDLTSYEQDTLWNEGYVHPPGFENYDTTALYPQHSTFGNGINVDAITNNPGDLFYNTGENLPAFYTIEYGAVSKNDHTVDRFLYKIELNSEHQTNTPIIDSVKFVINNDQEI